MDDIVRQHAQQIEAAKEALRKMDESLRAAHETIERARQVIDELRREKASKVGSNPSES